MIISGNQGVKDQIMALKWVKDNIDRFGGNPEKITLFGEDSGAASITIMAMSPLAQVWISYRKNFNFFLLKSIHF